MECQKKNNNYVRPIKTFTDGMTPEEIDESLQNYKQITHSDLYNIKLGTHFRYFKTDSDGKRHFRLGGNIINISGLPDYVVFGNGKITWSVQVKGTLFFQKISVEDIQNNCSETIKQKEILITEQKKEIQLLKKIIKKQTK